MGINDFFVPPKDHHDREEWEADQSRKAEMRERMERAREAPADLAPRLRDAVSLAMKGNGIVIKHDCDLLPQRDDDVRGGGWWVPMWIFVPGGNRAPAG